MPKTRAIGVLLAMSFVLGSSACEMKSALDSKKVEENIKTELEKQTGTKAKKVKCPETVWEKKGDTFQCEATAEDDSTIKVEVTMEGDGKVKWKTVSGASSASPSGKAKTDPAAPTAPAAEKKLLNSKAVEAHIASELEKQTGNKPSSVTCPAEQEEKVGGTFNCTATADDGSTATIEVTMKGNGDITWQGKPGTTAPTEPAPAPEE